MKKTILHIIETLGTGGAERSLVENIALMNDFDHVVVILSGPEDFCNTLIKNGGRFINLDVKKYNIFHNALILRKIIKNLKPALIHTNLYYANQAGRIAARLSGTPVLSSIVSTTYDPVRFLYEPALIPWKHNILKLMDRLTAAFSQCHFMAISNCVKKSAIKYTGFRAQRISVIHRGVDLERFVPNHNKNSLLRNNLGLTERFPVLLNIGRLVPSKGQNLIIEAMPKILKIYPTAHLLIAGSGNLLGILQGLVEQHNLQGSVTFLGKRSDIPDVHGVSDLFVFPSLWEGLGVSLIEAMALGKPVAASNSGPFPEIVEDGRSGVLFTADSSDAIANTVIQMFSQGELLADMGECSRAIAESKFDIRKNILQLKNLYSEMITRSVITVGL